MYGATNDKEYSAEEVTEVMRIQCAIVNSLYSTRTTGRTDALGLPHNNTEGSMDAASTSSTAMSKESALPRYP